MKTFAWSFVLFISFNTVYSQTGWYWQNPTPQGNTLNDIFFINDSCGWAVGDYGTILFSSSSGNSWQKQKSFTTNRLYSVFFHSSEDGWVVGPYGTIGHWNGESWEEQNSGFSGHLYDICFISPLEGWAVGMNQTVLHTTDGGNTWNILTTGGPEHYFTVHFISENEGYLAGAANYNGVIKHTANGGQSWSIEIVPAHRMNAITFANENSGWAVGDNGAIFHKQGSEGEWVIQNCGSDKNLVSVSAVSENQVWITGDDGMLFHSVNGGDSWIQDQTGTDLDLNAVFLLNGQKGWAAGKAGILIRTGDGGLTWHSMNNKGPRKALSDIAFIYPELGIVVGEEGLICSTLDLGETWQTDPSATLNNLYAVDIFKHYFQYDRAVAVGKYGIILRKWWEPDMTAEDWTEREYSHHEDLNGIYIRGSNMWAAGQFGSIAYSGNTGKTWELQHQDMAYHLNDIHFPTLNYGYAVGLFGSILHTENKGLEWVEQTSPVNASLYSLCFCNVSTGWAVGNNGTIIHTKDKGRTWVEQESGTSDFLSSVFFTDCNNGWVVGDQGLILHTNNGGESWGKQTSGTSNILTSVYFADPLNGWICGENGTILRTQDGGGTTYHEIGRRFNLEKTIRDFEILYDTLEIVEPEEKKNSTSPYKLVAVEVVIDTIIHSAVSDLECILSHNDLSDTIVFRSGGAHPDFINLKLSDAAEIPVDSGVPPFTGVFMPWKPLSVFSGTDPDGKWILEIRDGAANNTGSLNAWSLVLYMGKDDPLTGTGTIKLPDIPDYNLHNYPNPFTEKTVISWYQPAACEVEAVIYTIFGRRIATLFKGIKPAGKHEITWDASDTESGVYIIRLKSGTFCQTLKTIHVRK